MTAEQGKEAPKLTVSAKKGVKWLAGAVLALSLMARPGCVSAQGTRPSPSDASNSDFMSPDRPTIGNSASVQAKGVLQVELGYDAYPGTPPGQEQTVDAAFYYTPTSHLRLDFDISSFSLDDTGDAPARGIGTIELGGRYVLHDDRKHHWLPGIGVQYEAELPTASAHGLQNLGQQAILLLNHHVGRFNVFANGSIVQADCQTRSGCSYGGQQSAGFAFHLRPDTSLYGEAFGQNVQASNTPPGSYIFGGFLHRFSARFAIDGGLRFGVSDHSSSIGTTLGLVYGKQL